MTVSAARVGDIYCNFYLIEKHRQFCKFLLIVARSRNGGGAAHMFSAQERSAGVVAFLNECDPVNRLTS